MRSTARTRLLTSRPASTGWRRLSRCSKKWRSRTRIKVAEDRFAAGFHLEFSPLPRAETDESCAGEVHGRLIDFIRCFGGVGAQDSVSAFTVEFPDSIDEGFGRGLSL